MHITQQPEPCTPSPIRVFLIVRHTILLWGMQQLIKNQASTMLMVGSAANSADALFTLPMANPDVIVLDLNDEHMLDAIPYFVTESQAKILALNQVR